MYLNLIFGIYMGGNKPWIPRLYNRIELFNELIVGFSTFTLVYFTDFIKDVEQRSSLGWLLISSVTLLCAVNLFFVLRAAL